MSTFPKLKTNAVTQYPATRATCYQNQRVRFLGGEEQRYRDYTTPLHRWEIKLEALDEGEMAAIEAFFAANQGRFGTFAFTDPWDGLTYAICCLESDTITLTSVEEMQGKTSLTIVESRG